MALPGKLWKWKKWLTMPDAARHLSIMFDEEVNEADILRLALDGHLKLSVNFVNGAYVKRGGTFLPFDQWEANLRGSLSKTGLEPIGRFDNKIGFYSPGQDVVTVPADGPTLDDTTLNSKLLRPEEYEMGMDFLKERSPDQQSALVNHAIESIVNFAKKKAEKFGGKMSDIGNLSENISSIEANEVWDLPMIGNERLDIEHAYQQQTSGPSVTGIHLDGAFVEGPEGILCQLQDELDEEFLEKQYGEEGIKRSVAFYAECLKKRISNNEIDEEEAEKLLEKRKQNLNKPRNRSDDYYPAGGLPSDSVLVVRISALSDLQVLLEKENEKEANGKATVKDDIGIKERGTWLKIIYLLAAKLADTKPAVYRKADDSFNALQFETILKNKAGDILGNDDNTENTGHGLSNDNLKKIFDEAKKLFS